MSEWPRVALGEVIQVNHGFAFPGDEFSDDRSLPTLVTPGNFAIGGGFQESRPKTFSGNVHPEYVLRPGDLLITMTDLSKQGDTLGLPALVPDDGRTYLHNQRIGLVRVFDPTAVDRRFLSYYLRISDYRSYILGTASGSTVKHTSPSRILSYEAKLPPLVEQRAIADVLGALDDKIVANDKLADVADALIRGRYAAFCEQASDLVRIGELIDFVREGVDPDSLDGATPYVGLEHIPRHRMWLSERGDVSEVSSIKSRFREGDVLFGKLRPYFHKVVSAPWPGICSTDVLVLRAMDPSLFGLALATLSSDDVVAAATAPSRGTRMPRTSWQDLAAVQVPWSGNDAARALSHSVSQIRDAVIAALDESRTLASLRDALLPALMSGKIRVRDAEKSVEAAI